MKKIGLLLLPIWFALSTIAHASCYCNPTIFRAWAAQWPGFVAEFVKESEKARMALGGIAQSIGLSNSVQTGIDTALEKNKAETQTQANYERDDINRKAQAQMQLAQETVRQDTPMTRMQLAGECSKHDGASIDGYNAALGAMNQRKLEDSLRTHFLLNGRGAESGQDKGRGGDSIKQTRENRQKLGQKLQEKKITQIMPKEGLTYKDPEVAGMITEMLAMALTPDPWLDPKNLSFDTEEKANEYKAMLMMLDVMDDPKFKALSQYISSHTGTAKADPIHALVQQSGGPSAKDPNKYYPQDSKKNLSKADLYRAWAEHYLSPATAAGINSSNASSAIHELLARMLLVISDGNEALQNAMAILAIKQSGAREQIEGMRASFMNAARGKNAKN